MLQERLRTLRKEAKLSQRTLAAKVGMSQQALAKYEAGDATPNPERLRQLAQVLHVSVDYLLGGEQREIGSPTVPVLGQVAAGVPIEAIEDIEGEVPLSEDMTDGNYFALRIHGHSMEPRMREGDIVIVRQQPDIENGQVAVVMVGNESATCKKILLSKDGITLISTNPAYDPMFFSGSEVEQLPVRILGRVVELRAKY